MNNVFQTDNKTDELMRVRQLAAMLRDYIDAYPDEKFVHEAWLTVISKIDDLE